MILVILAFALVCFAGLMLWVYCQLPRIPFDAAAVEYWTEHTVQAFRREVARDKTPY